MGLPCRLVVVYLAALLLRCSGTTRFVMTRAGTIEARRPPQVTVRAEAVRTGNVSAEELADVAFLNLPGAQPKRRAGSSGGGGRHGRSGAFLSSGTEALVKAIATANGISAGSNEVVEVPQLKKAGSRTSSASEATEPGSEASLALNELAYLYDEATLAGGTVLTESNIPPNGRHQSPTGLDEPDWAALHTPWDGLRGVLLRANHRHSLTEKDIEAMFLDQGGVYAVRESMQRKLLESGRGKSSMWTIWSHLGNTFRATGHAHRAIQCFRRALYLKPDDPDVLLNLAVLLQNVGYLDDAEQLIRRAVSNNPRGVLHLYVLGNILNDQGKVSEAIQSYQSALALQPKFMPCIQKLRSLGGDPDPVVESAGSSTIMRNAEAALALGHLPVGPEPAAGLNQPLEQREEEGVLMLSHLVGLLLFLLGALFLIGCSEEFDDEEDEECVDGLQQKRKIGNRKKARRKMAAAAAK